MPPACRGGSWRRRRLPALLVLIVSLAAAGSARAATITVNTSADDSTASDGSVSLREAIAAIDAGSDLADPDITAARSGSYGTSDAIAFSGAFTIPLTGALPAITKPITIDGARQVTLEGSGAGTGTSGLTLAAGSATSTIEGLTIASFSGDGVDIQAGGQTTVIDNTFENDGGYGIEDSGNGDQFLTATGTPNALSGDGAGIAVGTGSPLIGPVTLSPDRLTVSAPFTGATPGATLLTAAFDNADGACEAAGVLTTSTASANVNGNGSFSINLPSALPAGDAVSVLIVDPTTGSSALACPGVYSVTNADPGGPGSLSQAITDADAGPPGGEIAFHLGSVGSQQTIMVSTPLPSISQPLTLDGLTQGGFGYTGAPLVTIQDSGATGDGLTLATGSAGSTVEGLAVTGFPGNGVAVNAGGGTSVLGDALSDNGAYGIDDAGTGDTLVGPSGGLQNSFTANGLGPLAPRPGAPRISAMTLSPDGRTLTVPFSGASAGGTVTGIVLTGTGNCQGAPDAAPVSSTAGSGGSGTLTFQLSSAATSQLSVLLFDAAEGAAVGCADFVTDTNDTGAGSLRQAILNANLTAANADQIDFAIPGSGVQTIAPLTALPTIIAPVTLDALTQGAPGYSGPPLVEINGANVLSSPVGLELTAPGTVEGVAIDDFASQVSSTWGVGLLAGSGGSTIEDDYIGVGPTGNQASNGTGVYVQSSNDTISGDTISDNAIYGIHLGATAAGTAISGDTIDGNGGDGIFVEQSTHTTISGGGAAISGNGGHGVAIAAASSAGNTVRDYSLAGNLTGNFSINGPAMLATAALSADGGSVVVKVTGASPSRQITAEAGLNSGCSNGTQSFTPYSGNSAGASTNAAGAATITIPVSLPSPDGVSVLVTDPVQGTYAVPGCAHVPPTAGIQAPAGGGTYALGASVQSFFYCLAGTASVTSCADSSGGSAPASTLDTATPGAHTYTVTATGADGLTGTAHITYTVAAPPSASITTPANGATYVAGQHVASSFSCSEGAFGPGLVACAGTVPDGGALASAHAGRYTFAVTATSADGQTALISATYNVVLPSNAFTVTQVKAKHGGSVTLRVTVSWGGQVQLVETSGASTFAKARLNPARAGSTGVTLTPNASGKRLLKHGRKLTVQLQITFTPAGGVARSRSLRVQLSG